MKSKTLNLNNIAEENFFLPDQYPEMQTSLSIRAKNIEKYYGVLWIESELNKDFVFNLPLPKSQD